MGSRIKSKDAKSLSGYLISDATPTNGEVLKYSSSSNKYEPSASGGVSASDIGAGLTYNTTTNKTDLGGSLEHNDSSNVANNVYFTPAAAGANLICWGLDSSYNPSGNYIGRFDTFTFSGKHEIHGAFQHSGVHIGLYVSNTPGVSFRQYKDVTQILGSGSGFPGGSSGMTYQEFDNKTTKQLEIWESEASNTKSYIKQTFNEFHWEIYDTNSYKTEIKANRTLFSASVANSTGTGSGSFFVRPNGINLIDEDLQGITSVPNATIVGKINGSYLWAGTGVQDSSFRDASTAKKGIRYINFGESDQDTGAGASYSTLVNTSLVPKKYVDDAVLAATDPNAIHKNASAEISTVTAKTDIEQEDLVIIEDSNSGAFTKKSVTRRNFIKPVDRSQTSVSTLTCNLNISDQDSVTALAAALTIAAPVGTLTNALRLVIRIKDDGTARALTWNAIFRVIGVTLPTTTTANKTVYIGCIYNSTDTKWDVVAVKQEA